MYPSQIYSPTSDNLVLCIVCVNDSPTETVATLIVLPFLFHSMTAITLLLTPLADTVQVKSILSPTVNVLSIGVTVIVGSGTIEYIL